MTCLRLFIVTACLIGGVAADWPQFLGPQRDGTSPEKGLLDTWPAAGPAVVWQREVGEGYASPVVADGRLVLFHRVGNEEVIECLTAEGGKPVWKQSYRTDYSDDLGKGDGPRSTPVVAADRVFTLGAAGRLTCLDFKTGKELWAKPLQQLYEVRKGFFGVGTSPLVEGKAVLVNVGGQGAGIVAFAVDSGKELWKATDHEASYASPIAATIAGDRLALFFTREGLVGVEVASGAVRFSQRWRARLHASVNAASPVLLDSDKLFLSACYGTGAGLWKLKRDSAEQLWKNGDALSCHFSTPVAQGDLLIGFDGRQEEGARLRAIDWKTGKVRWSEEGYGCGSLVRADGKLFVMTEDGRLVLGVADANEFRVRSKAQVLTGPVRAHLALANGLLYGRDDRKLVCWKVKP
jgi:outer membrane protein assembly factor BamB